MLVRTFEARDISPACQLTNHFIKNTGIHFGAACLTDAEFAESWRAGVVKGSARSFPWLVVEVEGRLAGYAKAGTWACSGRSGESSTNGTTRRGGS
jgi:L-amino acid N-acyltransferase YncA